MLFIWIGFVYIKEDSVGIEFEKNENLFVIRTGLEYEVEFGNHWDVAPTVFYDYRSNNFGTWSIGIGIGKRF